MSGHFLSGRFLKRAWPTVAILLLGLILTIVIATSGPEAPKRPSAEQARLVEVLPLELVDASVIVSAMGTVRPAREVDITAQVVGKVVEMGPALIPGGYAVADEPLLRIDPRDYEFVVRQRQSDLARAEQEWKLESGQQEIAKREYALLETVIDESTSELVLREPQLATARSTLDAARATLQKAELDLQRTTVRAPFNCIVLEKHVDLGTVVNPSSPAAKVVGTDAFWVEVAVPLEKLRWIAIPADAGAEGSVVRIRQPSVQPEGPWREGRVLRLMGDLETEGRMARLLVEVADPYARQPENADAPALLVDAFVEAEIIGRELHDVIRVPRRYLHNSRSVWLRTSEGRLEIRDVVPAYSGEEALLVAEGLEAGEELVTSNISAPVPGMPLRVQGETARSPGSREDHPIAGAGEGQPSEKAGEGQPSEGAGEGQLPEKGGEELPR